MNIPQHKPGYSLRVLSNWLSVILFKVIHKKIVVSNFVHRVFLCLFKLFQLFHFNQNLLFLQSAVVRFDQPRKCLIQHVFRIVFSHSNFISTLSSVPFCLLCLSLVCLVLYTPHSFQLVSFFPYKYHPKSIIQT